ncbi:N-acetylglucosamine kinase [Rapidithrix thailandica]|uniref:N-acetylglucosamine kinase n=1 Tax=Rapidithrix thailandica TaxID=413964 RepID=A0AAW9S0M3_9BACT
MVLIADSGSTKTAWLGILPEGDPVKVRTEGINPYYQTEAQIVNIVREGLLPGLTGPVERVYFYGAGCSGPEKNSVVSRAIREALDDDRVDLDINSDLLGAARGLFHERPGIVGILGTGANAGMYNGEGIVKQAPSMGYVLGDEGSGAVLGKHLIGRVLRNQLPQEVIKEFYATYQLTAKDILNKIYQLPFPNRMLASFVPFIHSHIAEPDLHQLVIRNFEAFFKNYILPFTGVKSYEVNITGSVAYYFKEQLMTTANTYHLAIGRVSKDPLAGLQNFHKQAFVIDK